MITGRASVGVGVGNKALVGVGVGWGLGKINWHALRLRERHNKRDKK